jgi:ER membrane protein complex subunit 3
MMWQNDRANTVIIFTAANQMTQQMAQMNPSGAMGMGPEADPDKMFLGEAENLEVLEHHSIVDGIEDRLLEKLSKART